jgi:hypothetical protein
LPRTIPKLRKCRTCWRNFDPADLVVEEPTRDDRGYLVASARWCPEHAAERLVTLEADQRCVEDAARLRRAIERHRAARVSG